MAVACVFVTSADFSQICRYLSTYHETILAQPVMLLICLFLKSFRTPVNGGLRKNSPERDLEELLLTVTLRNSQKNMYN